MAAIRCPACGKPNPDILDVCQYCDARLKPLEGVSPDSPPAPSGDLIHCQSCGRDNPPDATFCQYCDSPLAPQSFGPGEVLNLDTGGQVKCPACGKLNPPELEICQYCEARLQPLTIDWDQPAALTGDQPAGLDWMNSLPSEPKVEPDWKWGGTEHNAADDNAEWAKSMTGAEPAAAPAEDVPDWMKSLGDEATTPAASTPETPDWLNSLGGQPAEPAAAPAEDVPDWMKPFGAAAAEPAPSFAAPAADSSTPDWMSAPAESAPAADFGTPDWMSAPAPATDSGTPEWMSAPAESAPAADSGTPDWMSAPMPAEPAPSFGAEPAEVPDWMSSLGGTPAEPAPSFGAEPAEVPDWMSSLGGTPAPAEPAPSFGAEPAEVPDWMSSLGGTPAPAEPAPSFGAEPAEVPDWMSSLGGTPAPAEPAPSFGAEPAEVPDWMSSLGGTPAPAEPAPSFGAEPAEVPDWMSSLGGTPAPAEPAPSFGAPAADFGTPDRMSSLGDEPAPKGTTPFMAEPAAETPDWLSSLGGAPTAPADETPAWLQSSGVAAPPPATPEEPDWMRDLGAPAAPPAAPVFGGAFTETPGEAAPAEGEMPDWLSSLRPADINIPSAPIAPMPSATPSPFGEMEPAGAFMTEPGAPNLGAAGLVAAGLAAGELPSWMQSMRPVQAQPSHVPPEVDNYQEKIGILAGMRGVLQAEPTIAKPRKSDTQVQKLLAGEAEIAQVALIAKILQEEAGEARPASKRKLQISLPVERWIVFAVLAIGIIVPWFFAVGFFPLPTTIGREANAAFETIESLPNTKPALIAFDYDPAQRGELDSAAEALIFHLMRRGVTVVGVSTRPAGPGIAEDVFAELTLALKNTYGVSYTYGTHYLNLGYIPGGPVGLLQFAAQPRSLFNRDFSGNLEVWNAASAPGMQTINALGDFGVIVLVTATPDAARAWVEQTQAFAANVPMLAAVSAGADPLVRPYYETSPQQIRGLVSGLIGAAQYEQRAGLSGPASARWDALGGGLLTASLLLIAGNLFSGLMGFRRSRKR